MIIGIPKEIKNKENRVPLTPAGAKELVKRGHTVYVQHTAGINSGFADDNTRCMVDKEVFADGCACVDVNASAAMGVFGHDAGDKRDVPRVQFVSDAVYEDSEEARIREDNFFFALRGWVAIKSGLNIGKQHALDFG